MNLVKERNFHIRTRRQSLFLFDFLFKTFKISVQLKNTSDLFNFNTLKERFLNSSLFLCKFFNNIT